MRKLLIVCLLFIAGCPGKAQSTVGKEWIVKPTGLFDGPLRESNSIRWLKLGERATELERGGSFRTPGIAVKIRAENGDIGWISDRMLIDPKDFTEEYQMNLRLGPMEIHKTCLVDLKPLVGLWQKNDDLIDMCAAGLSIAGQPYAFKDDEDIKVNGNTYTIKLVSGNAPITTLTIQLVDENTVLVNGVDTYHRILPTSLPETSHGIGRIPVNLNVHYRQIIEWNFCGALPVLKEFEMDREWVTHIKEIYVVTTHGRRKMYLRPEDPRERWPVVDLNDDGQGSRYIGPDRTIPYSPCPGEG